MTAVFLKALNISIMAGWLILAAAFVRLLLKKTPKWINCMLWILVAVRLVCPVSIRSTISLIPGSEVIPADILVSQTPEVQSEVRFVNETVNPVPAGTIPESAASNTTLLQQLITAAAYLWIAGMTAMMIYAVLTWIKLKKSVAASVPVRDGIVACDEVESPFILGILRPIIYAPSSMTGETLDYVVRHEQAHLKRYDHWWKPLGYLLLSVYWFNPLCWLAYILFCRDIELACDEKVIRDMNREETASYARALLDCSMPVRRIAVCPLAFGEVGVKERIKGVLNYKKPAFWSVIAAVLVCVIVAGCFMTTPENGSISQTGKESQIEESADLTLDKELAHKDEFVSFLKTHLDGGDAEYVRIDTVGEVVYLDYQLNGVRYIAGYRLDGTVEKTVRVNNTIYYIDSDHPEPEMTELEDDIPSEPADLSNEGKDSSYDKRPRPHPYFDRPHVVSSSPMNGAYAFGHVAYSDTIAAAYTASEGDGCKYVSVYGIYLSDSGIKRTEDASAVSTTRGNVGIYVMLPEDGIRFLGVNSVHKVKVGNTTWGDSAWIGEQQYD